MRSKGIIGMIALVLLAMVAVGSLLAWTWSNIDVNNAIKASLSTKSNPGASTIVLGSQFTSSSCKYQYTNVKPYYNWYFQDLTGTAIRPAVYIYNVNPATLSNGAYWGDERAWTDGSDYIHSGTADANGKLQLSFDPGTPLWFHAVLSGYKTIFDSYTTVSCGDVTADGAVDTGTGLKVGTFTMGQYDTTVWTASAIDFGVTTNYTNTKYVSYVNSPVASKKVVSLSQIKLVNVSTGTPGTSGSGIHKLEILLGDKSILVYDSDANIDNTDYVANTPGPGQIYDSSKNPTDKALVQSQTWTSGQGTIGFRVFADTRDVTSWAAGYCGNGNVTAKVYLYDAQGNALINGQSLTC